MAGRVAPYIDNTGLVFAYDQSNTVRSYLGEPTTNIMPYSQEFTSWGSNAVTLTANAAYAPDGTLTATLLKADGTASYHYIYQYLSTDSSATYTFSCYVKPAGGFNGNTNTFFMQTNDGSWKNTTFNLSSLTPSSDGWYRVSWTVSIATGGSLFWSIYPSPAPSAETAGGGYYIWGAQLEKKSHVTQYLPTGASTATRSATQGLKDLTGRSTIDLSNVSFDSSAQMTFDGTDDYVGLAGFTQPSNPNIFSVEAVVKLFDHNAGTNIGSVIVNNYSSLNGWIFFLNGPNSKLSLRHHNGSATSYNVEYSSGINLNQWYHIAATDDGAVVRIYLNGTQVVTGTSATSTNYSGQPLIGQFGGGNAMTYGNITVVRIYNRTLSASEIQQNFNAVRGRYGI